MSRAGLMHPGVGGRSPLNNLQKLTSNKPLLSDRVRPCSVGCRLCGWLVWLDIVYLTCMARLPPAQLNVCVFYGVVAANGLFCVFLSICSFA
jgi:hypothetical protein